MNVIRKAALVSPVGAILLLTFMLLTLRGTAQMTTGTILGTVEDETGAVLPGVEITVRNIDTGTSRTVSTEATGIFNAPQLPLGVYEVTAKLAGFQAGVRRGITLTVGREAVVNFRLPVGEIAQSVEVMGEAPMIQTGSSDVGGLVDDQRIRELPLNGRDFTQLVLLQPGVVQQRFTRDSPNTGQGVRIAAGGSRMDSNNFLIDGTRKIDFGGTSPGSVAGVQLGVDAIREFRVLTHNFSAEFGQNAGAIIAAVTRAGTNALHGSAFEFHRNDNFDARNFFDRGKAPEFKRNQFGGSLGGPIVRDRTHFFGTYEAFRERRGVTGTAFTPTTAARQGLLTDPATNQPISVNPQVRPFLDLFPLPNGPDLGGGAGVFSFAFSEPRNEDFFSTRIDHRFSDKDTIFGRYQFSDADRAEPLALPVFKNVITSRQQMITLSETHVFSPRVVNSLSLGYNRASPKLNSLPTVSINPSLMIPGRNLTAIVISELEGGSIGSAGGAISQLSTDNIDGGYWITNSFQVKEDLNYIRGAHSIKTGAYFERLQYNITQPTDRNGVMNFASLAQFLQGRPSRFTILLEPADAARAWRQTVAGIYMQDDWRATPSLTLNLGLRWEMITPHDDRLGRNAIVHDPLASDTVILDSMYSPGMKNFGPRVGFAWDPFGDGKTSLRGGAGIFHNLLTGVANRIGSTINPPFGGRYQANNPPFLPSLAIQAVSAAGGAPRPAGWPEHLPEPTVYHFNFNIERQMFRETVLRVGYSGSQGRHLLGLRNINTVLPEILPDGRKFFAAGRPLRNPNFAIFDWFETTANSFYNAMEVSVNRRARVAQFQVSYTFSKAVDDQSSLTGATNFVGGTFLLDPDDRKSNRGRSINDARHNFVANFGYELPIGPGKAWNLSGVGGKVLGGWQLNGIATATSGIPLSPIVGFNRSRNRDGRVPDRPDLVPGRSNNPALGKPERWFDPTAFSLPEAGFFGTLGSRTVDGPGVAVFDFSLVKDTAITERTSIQFRAEFFNLFNRVNFGLPRVNMFEPNGALIGNVGRVTDTVVQSRELQFGLKFIF